MHVVELGLVEMIRGFDFKSFLQIKKRYCLLFMLLNHLMVVMKENLNRLIQFDLFKGPNYQDFKKGY